MMSEFGASDVVCFDDNADGHVGDCSSRVVAIVVSVVAVMMFCAVAVAVVCVCVCVFIKLHITAQPGSVKLIFQCYSNGSAPWGISG